ncbi:unnamed protein product [Nezara viridula]|uniref:Uncharacterized protein n=1 Tax=Nezara viridula TaxID=85310 RepID=A0A9P0MVZ1_NEZVI|nr:unnamed protein product [Nezara viridula]
MAFAAARMILKDKRRKSSKEDFARSKSKEINLELETTQKAGSLFEIKHLKGSLQAI